MRSFSFLLATTALAACSPYDPDLGGVPYQCGDTEPKCPEGYSCQSDGNNRMLCMATDGNTVDARQMGGFVCQDDGQLEPNDSKDTAFVINAQTIKLGPVSICPEGDRDTYQINVQTAMSNVAAITTWEGGMPVSVSILNAGGSTIKMGVSSGENSMRADVTMLPIGIYYVQTYAAANVKNNYRLDITISQQ